MDEINVQINDPPTLEASIPASAVIVAGGTTYHSMLSERDLADQHPISAITGLEKALESKIDSENMQDAVEAALALAKESGEFKGEKGDTGDLGPQGPQGEKGEAGDVGPQGPQGEKGEAGDIGPQGPQGEKGEMGDVGPQGPQGEKGDTGDVGPQGEPGADGVTISYIATSVNGDTGYESKTIYFSDGKKVVINDGVQGPQGEKGEKGDPGVTTWGGLEDKPVVSVDHGETLIWDGDISGRAVWERDGYGWLFYKVCGAVPELGDLANGGTILHSNGNSGEFTADNIYTMGTKSALVTYYACVIHPDDAAELGAEAGVYFRKMSSSSWLSSLTVNNYTFTEEKIAPSHLYQPDWMQNDATAADFVKNRPFYEKVTVTEIMPETAVTGSANGDYYISLLDVSLFSGEEEKLKIVFDGAEYLCAAHSELSMTWFGNMGMVNSQYYTDTGEPFALLLDVHNSLCGIYLPDDASHTMSIENHKTDITLLDKRFIGADWLASKSKKEELIYSGNGTVAANTLYTYSYAVYETLVKVRESSAGRIIWNGVEYDCSPVSVNCEISGVAYSGIAFGNLHILSSAAYQDTGEPFMILYQASEDGRYAARTFCTNVEGAYTCNEYITTIVRNQIPEEYIPRLTIRHMPTAMKHGDKELILSSSTSGSTKTFKLTVDDSGTITATEIA